MASKIVDGLIQGNRATLAASITLVETEHKGKKKLAQKVLERILQNDSLKTPNSYRIGLSLQITKFYTRSNPKC